MPLTLEILMARAASLRVGLYVFDDAESIELGLLCGVFAVAHRLQSDLSACLIGETQAPKRLNGGLTVVPDYAICDAPPIDALVICGGPGIRREIHNRKLQEFVLAQPMTCTLASSGTGSWLFGCLGLLDGLTATCRSEPDRIESSHLGKTPINRLAELAPSCRISRARIVDTPRIITSAGMSAALELALHLIGRAGHDESLVHEIVRLAQCQRSFFAHRDDIEYAPVRTAHAIRTASI
jgi:transcriptional regulator GlxA family with amidase domain